MEDFVVGTAPDEIVDTGYVFSRRPRPFTQASFHQGDVTPYQDKYRNEVTAVISTASHEPVQQIDGCRRWATIAGNLLPIFAASKVIFDINAMKVVGSLRREDISIFFIC